MDTIFLSQREMDVAELRAQGKTSYEIADELGLSWHTVRTYEKTIYLKFGVRKNIHLAIRMKEVNTVVFKSPVKDIKARARAALACALNRGLIRRKPCRECGARKVQGHHTDYAKPLDVIWLCAKHHQESHRNHSSP